MLEAHITDEYLIAAIGESDYRSYNRLFERYYVRLCQYVYSLLTNKDDAEDVVQELFLSLWKNRTKIEIRENASAYLYKMAKHLTLNYLRTQNRYTSLPENQEQGSLCYEENFLEADELRLALYDCVDRLPERSREVLLLHRIEGLKQKEISEQLTISIKTIKNQIWASLQRLKKCLEIKGI